MEKIIGKVTKIQEAYSVSGEKLFEGINSSMLYKFDKQKIMIFTNQKRHLEIDFIGKKINLLKNVTIGTCYEFEVEIKSAYGQNYYNCKFLRKTKDFFC